LGITICGWRIISKELNIPVYHDNQIYFWNKTFLGHGDGKGPGDKDKG
jgi:hypothetical protein